MTQFDLGGTPASPLASLLVRDGLRRGERLPVRAPIATVGSGDGNHIVLAEPGVSPAHARLYRLETIWMVADLGSGGGTEVDGEPVAGDVPLAPGATLRFGDVAVLFDPADAESPPPAPPRRADAVPGWLAAALVAAAAAIALLLLI